MIIFAHLVPKRQRTLSDSVPFAATEEPRVPRDQHMFSQTRKWRSCPPEQSLAIAFVRNARTFHAMAWPESDRSGVRSAYASAIAIELGLKAYLLHRGFSDDWNRIHLRHDLKKALRCARLAGLRELPDGLAELAAVLGPLYASGDLRSGAVEPELTVSPEAADRVISRFLDVVETAIRMEGGAGP